MRNIKLKKIACIMAACCLLAGCEKKNDNSSNSPDTNVTDAMTTTDSETTMDAEITTDTEATTDVISENTQSVLIGTDIPEDAVLKVTETTYRFDEVFETRIYYKNAHDDSVAFGYVQYGGKEVLTSHNEYKYDDNGKKIYKKTISDRGEYSETEYHDNVEKTKGYDEIGRLDVESEATFDEFGNYIMEHTIVYDEEGEVILEIIEDYSDCDYDENGNILVCRQRSESGEIISTTTNTYDDNGNILLSEKVFSDNENNGRLSNSSKSHSYEYDDKNNLISEEEITKSNTDIVRVTASYEYRYDENGRKVRQDHTYVDIDTDLNISEYTIYEYTEL